MSKHPKTPRDPCPLADRCNGTLRPGECVCVRCRNDLRADLIALVGPDAALLDELETTRARQVASSQASGARGKNDPPLPFDLRVGDTLAELRRHLEDAALVVWSAHGSASVHELGTADPRGLAIYLLEHLDQLQRSEFAPEACQRIRAAVASVRRLVDIRPGRVYLGQCLCIDEDLNPCPAHLFVSEGARVATCPQCGAEHDVPALRAWLANLDGTLATLWTIANGLLPVLNERVPMSTLKSWVRRGKLLPAPQPYTEAEALYLDALDAAGIRPTGTLYRARDVAQLARATRKD